MGKRPYEEIGGVRVYDNPLVDGVTDRRVFITEPTKIQRGVPFNCSMYDVRCMQDCVSGGIRHTDKCPFDNYISKGKPKIPKGYQGTYAKNSDGGATLIMVTSEQEISNKGASRMAKNNNNSGNFQKTFVKYVDMNEREKGIFKQGATTANNNVKEKLGLKKPRPDNKNK